jgi:hypothetical protein
LGSNSTRRNWFAAGEEARRAEAHGGHVESR